MAMARPDTDERKAQRRLMNGQESVTH